MSIAYSFGYCVSLMEHTAKYSHCWHYWHSSRDLDMGSANDRRRYIVTSSLIGWAHTQTDSLPSILIKSLQSFWKSGTRRFHLRTPDLQTLKRKCCLLGKFSSLVAQEVIKMTPSSATNDKNLIKMITFPFKGMCCSNLTTQIAKTIGSTSIRDRCLIGVDPRVFAV